MPESCSLWPEDAAAPWPDGAFDELFSPPDAATSELVDRHGLVSYGTPGDQGWYGREEYLGGVGVGGRAFLRACDPHEWGGLRARYQRAVAAHEREHGRPPLVVMFSAAESADPIPEARAAAILAAVGLTTEDARAWCRGISGGISGAEGDR